MQRRPNLKWRWLHDEGADKAVRVGPQGPTLQGGDLLLREAGTMGATLFLRADTRAAARS
ncbi:hypothetical protein SXCC_00045 [Gluconacetobacter sp. SXCC-1]|nr:hypothetical protein SXCC_00045 [Gluconacetobacter sp. SXCC-1]